MWHGFVLFMLIAVNLDTGGTNRKKIFFALAQVSYILFGMIGTLS